MEYIHDVHLSQYELQQNPNGFFNGSTETRTRSWIQEHQHQTQHQAQQPIQPTGIQVNPALFYGQQQHQHQQIQQQNQQPPQQPHQQPQHHQQHQQLQHQSINQQTNHHSISSFNQQSNSSWFQQQPHQQQQHQQLHQQPLQQQPNQQQHQYHQLQHQSTLQWTQLDSFNLSRVIDQSTLSRVNYDLLLNPFQSQSINQQQHQQPHQHQQTQQQHQYQQPQAQLFPNQNHRQRHDLLYYKQLQEQESQQIYNQQQQHQPPHQQPHQPPHQQPPKPLPNKVLFKFILNLTKPEAEQYLVQIAQTPTLHARIRLVENERKNLTINLIETLQPTTLPNLPEEYVFISIELIIVKNAEDRKADEIPEEEDCLHVEEIEDEVEHDKLEDKNAENKTKKSQETQGADCLLVEEIEVEVEDKQAKLTRPSILFFSNSKDKEQVNVEKVVVEEIPEKDREQNLEQNPEKIVATNVETNDETQNVEDPTPDSQTLQTFSDQDVEFNGQSNTTVAVSIDLDETVDEVKGGSLKVNPERSTSSSEQLLIIENVLPDSSSSLLCTEDMPISPFLDQIKLPLGSIGQIDPIETSTDEASVQLDPNFELSTVEPVSGTETNCDSDATEIDNETVNVTEKDDESAMKRTRTSSTVSNTVPKRSKRSKVESSKSPLQIKRKSTSKPKQRKHYHQSHLDLSSIIQSTVSTATNKRLTRSTASLAQKQQSNKRTRSKSSNKSTNKLKRN